MDKIFVFLCDFDYCYLAICHVFRLLLLCFDFMHILYFTPSLSCVKYVPAFRIRVASNSFVTISTDWEHPNTHAPAIRNDSGGETLMNNHSRPVPPFLRGGKAYHTFDGCAPLTSKSGHVVVSPWPRYVFQSLFDSADIWFVWFKCSSEA